MPLLLRLFLILAMGLPLLATPAHAQNLPQPPEIAARSYLLLDLSSDRVLAEREADARVDPASLTKLMTAWLVFDAIRQGKLGLQQALPVSRRAWAERKGGGSLMFIDTTMTPTVDELLRGMIAVSGNDAAVALAEAVGGSLDGFVAAMNRQAQAWGLKNTQFRNVTGLTESGHYSSGRDILAIAAHVLRDFPQHYATYYGIRQYTYNGIRQDNRNMLLGRDPTVDGMKTGFTDAAGYCLVASAERAMPNGRRRLLSVVLGTASREARAAESGKLLNWGYTAWDAVRVLDPAQAVAKVPVWKGKAPDVALGVAQPLWATVPAGQGAQLRTVVDRIDPLVAPLAKGQRVGTVKVSTAAGAAVAQAPLVVQEPVELAGLLGRAWDSIRLWVQ